MRTLAALLVVLALVPRARGQTDDALLLARSAVSERGWRVESTDLRAIAEVVRARVERRGGTFAESLEALAPRLHGGTITSRVWLLDLGRDGHRPRGLSATWTRPRGAEPSRHDAWIATLAEADDVVAGRVESPCETRPSHWGSRSDVARRRAAGYRWVSIDCGAAENLYGHLYRRREADPE